MIERNLCPASKWEMLFIVLLRKKKKKEGLFRLNPKLTRLQLCAVQSKADMAAALVLGSPLSGEGRCKEQRVVSSVFIPLNFGSRDAPAWSYPALSADYTRSLNYGPDCTLLGFLRQPT